MNEIINELTTNFAKKGFLIDRDSAEFFAQFNAKDLSEDILNRIFALTKVRIISKKTISAHFDAIRPLFAILGKEAAERAESFFSIGEPLEKSSITANAPIASVPAPDLKILSSNVIPYRRIEVKDFVTHFKNRYNFFKELLKDRKELSNLMSVNKIGTNKSFSLIALVSQKRVTKNKNIILEVEDLTGKTNILVSQDKEDLMKKAKEVLVDDVLGLKCSGNGNFIYANEILFAECGVGDKKKSAEEGYAIFTSDMHVGSKLFLKDNFEKFLKWINGDGVDAQTAEKVKKIKYMLVAGDNVDGVGIYPGQEALLEIKDMRSQYKKLAEYFKRIPSHIKIIMCPGQHDAVRVPEPQPPIDADFAKELTEMKNVYLVSNPALVEIDSTERKPGFKVLMYHGASMIRTWIDEVEDLRLGQAHTNPSKVVKYMLRHRHLSPTHSGNVYIPSEKEDTLVIKEIPDIVVTGDLHKSDIDIYNNILIICGSCWQSMTPFEEKVGNHPDPCKVPMLNLKTREIKILDFS